MEKTSAMLAVSPSPWNVYVEGVLGGKLSEPGVIEAMCNV